MDGGHCEWLCVCVLDGGSVKCSGLHAIHLHQLKPTEAPSPPTHLMGTTNSHTQTSKKMKIEVQKCERGMQETFQHVACSKNFKRVQTTDFKH